MQYAQLIGSGVAQIRVTIAGLYIIQRAIGANFGLVSYYYIGINFTSFTFRLVLRFIGRQYFLTRSFGLGIGGRVRMFILFFKVLYRGLHGDFTLSRNKSGYPFSIGLYGLFGFQGVRSYFLGSHLVGDLIGGV